MGCGASGRAAPPQDVAATAEADAGVGTWATKTAPPTSTLARPSENDIEMFASRTGGSQTGAPIQYVDTTRVERGSTLVIDADEDFDDGVEVIDAGQQAPEQPAAANGQEPPEMEEETRRPEPKPLPKQQQEEAAKLAEARKRFENKKYQNQQKSAETIPFEMPGMIDTGLEVVNNENRPWEVATTTKGPPASEERTYSGPNTDLSQMIGLNLTEPMVQEHVTMDLPGGIFDDLEVFQQPMEYSTKNREPYEKEKTGSFDDEDEMMMKEILDNFDA